MIIGVVILSIGGYMLVVTQLFHEERRALTAEYVTEMSRAKAEEVRVLMDATTGALASETVDDWVRTNPSVVTVGFFAPRAEGEKYERTRSVVNATTLAGLRMTSADLTGSLDERPLPFDAVASGALQIFNVSRPPNLPLLAVAAATANPREVAVAVVTPDQLLRSIGTTRLGSVYVVDHQGNVIVHSDTARTVSRENLGHLPVVQRALERSAAGQALEIDGPGGEVFAAFATVDSADLSVIAEVPKSVAFAAVQDITTKTVFFAFAILCAALLTAVYFSRRIAEPLSKLKDATKRIAVGDFEGEVDVGTRNEIGELADAVNEMSRELALRDQRLKDAYTTLQQQGRLASVGTLAAGVAHEINNPLTAVLGNLEHLGERIPELQEDTADLELVLEDMHTGVDRVRRVVRDLKMLSRAEDEAVGAVDVETTLESTLRMASQQITTRAKLVKRYTDVPPVVGNESRLGQVFLNLLVNAAQAIPEGQADRHRVEVRTRLADDGSVVIEVSDTGTGIDEQTKERLFDPFFTTKSGIEGMGLGLAISHRIVSQLSGRIEVDSELGAGSTFRVILPPAPQDTPPLGVEKPRIAAPKARVLVVDDEPAITTAFRRLLGPAHDVVGVQTADDALQALNGQDAFDVVFCDLIMPNVSGIKLFETISADHPQFAGRFVFMTGGAFTSEARNFLDQVDNRVLEKPFRASDLSAAIRDVLESRE